MKIQDLRLGSIIEYNGMDKIVAAINEDGFISFKTDPITVKGHSYNKSPSLPIINFKPIPLTEEWLVRFGFEKYEWTVGYFIPYNAKHLMIQFFRKDIHIYLTKVTKDSQGHKMSGGRDYFLKQKLNYIHQLQNLIHSLTGEELTLKK